MRVTKSGAGATSLTVSLSPLAVRPEMCGALPAMYALAPSMSAREPFVTAGPCILALRLRSIVYLNVWAVTGASDGGEKRNPLRIVKVYVFPSRERSGSD